MFPKFGKKIINLFIQEAPQTLSRINTKKTLIRTSQSKRWKSKAKTPRDTRGQGGDGEADIYTTAAGRQSEPEGWEGETGILQPAQRSFKTERK